MSDQKIYGIYVITNEVEKKIYVGSSIDIMKRKKEHEVKLEKNTHHNKNLQKAYNKSNDNFKMNIIPCKADVKIREIEQELILELMSTGILYNIALNTESPMTGRAHSEKTKEIMRVLSTGKKHSPETIEKLKELSVGRVPPREAVENSVKSRLGVPLSPERVEALRVKGIEAMKDPAARQHLSDVNIGIKHTPKDIQKMKEACVGRTFTPQAREASIAANTGRKMSDEHLAIIKAANTGLVRSEETRAKISAARKGFVPPRESMLAVWEANKGRVKSQHELDVARATLEKAREVQCKKVVVDDVVYNSINAAARELNVDKGTIYRRTMNEKYPNWNYV